MSEIKLCKDCKHYIERTGNVIKLCAVGKIEPVMGWLDESCQLARTPYGSCGVEAKNFEQKPETAQKPEPAFVEFNFPHQKERVWWKFWR